MALDKEYVMIKELTGPVDTRLKLFSVKKCNKKRNNDRNKDRKTYIEQEHAKRQIERMKEPKTKKTELERDKQNDIQK